MKKFLFYLFLTCLVSFGWRQYHHQKKSYIKKETYLRYVNRDLFLSKLAQPLPDWMQEQLQENFQDFERDGITRAQIDATFAQIRKTLPNFYIVRYRILNSELYRYFNPEESIALKDNSTECAIKTLLQCTRMPDLDFIISYYDGIRPNHIFFHTPSKELQAPLLISAKIKNTPYVVLIPDFRSIGTWWISDIKEIKSRMGLFPWDQKREFAIWRGANTKEDRIQLCRLSLRYPEYLDAKISSSSADPLLEKEGLTGNSISWEQFLECKYLPYVDGYMTAAPALQWRLLSNSVILKPETNEIQWFHRALKPYVHYIPIKADFSDLIEKLDWAKEHDSECKKVAEESTQFALNHLMYEDVLLYLNAVFHRYASLQKIDCEELKKETLSNPRWVKIHNRKALSKRATKDGYVPGALPDSNAIISSSETSPIP